MQGDAGRAPFEDREARSKICREEKNTADQRRAARVLRYLCIKSVDVQWGERIGRLRTRHPKPKSEGGVLKSIKVKER